MIRELELPVAALVSSGGKSLHAIVRIEAGSFEEYRSRVDYLYAVCEKNGLKVDRQNRNPPGCPGSPALCEGAKAVPFVVQHRESILERVAGLDGQRHR